MAQLPQQQQHQQVGLNTSMFQPSVNAYRDRLKRELTGAVYRFFYGMYDEEYKRVADFFKKSGSRARITDILRSFQARLSEIPKWNTDQTAAAADQIVKSLPSTSRHTEIIKILFISESMLLASIRTSAVGAIIPDIPVQIPTMEQYLYRVLYLVGKDLHNFPSMIRQQSSDDEHVAAKKTSYMIKCIHGALMGAIADLLPVHHIVDNYLSETIHGLRFESKSEDSAADAAVVQAAIDAVAEAADTAKAAKDEDASEAVAAAGAPVSADADKAPEAPAPAAAAVAAEPAAAPMSVAVPEVEDYGFSEHSDAEVTSNSGSDGYSDSESGSDSQSESESESEESESERKRRTRHVNLKK